jgi:hypothetical protein
MYQLGKIRYTHDAMIDQIIANPAISQGALAELFGFTQPWVSIVINSDAFRERLADRKAELCDPLVLASIEEKFKALADLSLAKLLRKLEATEDTETLFRGAELATKALGYGAKAPQAVQQNFVVMMPQVAKDAQSWAAEHRRIEEPKDEA